jgi:hypothetical protein
MFGPVPSREAADAAAPNRGADRSDPGFNNNPFADLDSKLSNASS